MIIESQTLKSKSDLQKAVSALTVSKAVIYKDVDKKELVEIARTRTNVKSISIIIIEH